MRTATHPKLRKIYGWFESELGKESLEETAVMRSTRRIIAALPSNVEPNRDETNPSAEALDKSKVE